MARTKRMALAALLAAIAPALATAAEPAAAAPKAERSLDAITIEGVVTGPEVLFINAREPARLALAHGWPLLAAAGLLEPPLPAARRLVAGLGPAAGDPTHFALDSQSDEVARQAGAE